MFFEKKNILTMKDLDLNKDMVWTSQRVFIFILKCGNAGKLVFFNSGTPLDHNGVMHFYTHVLGYVGRDGLVKECPRNFG